jgi:hypothetical protein
MLCACVLLNCNLLPHRLYSILPHYLRKNILNIKRVFRYLLQLLPETFYVLKRSERDMIEMYVGLNVKYPLFLPDFNET